MWNLKNEIGPRKVINVFIPGTHDSAAYGEYDKKIGDTRVKKYTITQVRIQNCNKSNILEVALMC